MEVVKALHYRVAVLEGVRFVCAMRGASAGDRDARSKHEERAGEYGHVRKAAGAWLTRLAPDRTYALRVASRKSRM